MNWETLSHELICAKTAEGWFVFVEFMDEHMTALGELVKPSRVGDRDLAIEDQRNGLGVPLTKEIQGDDRESVVELAKREIEKFVSSDKTPAHKTLRLREFLKDVSHDDNH